MTYNLKPDDCIGSVRRPNPSGCVIHIRQLSCMRLCNKLQATAAGKVRKSRDPFLGAHRHAV